MPRLGYSGGRPFLFAREAVIGVDPVTIGKGIDAAGGGIVGAIAILLVVLGIGIAFVIWKAYQKKITEQTEMRSQLAYLQGSVNQLKRE